MRMIIQIAKAEIRNLFYSPVAWFLILAFLVECAWFFTSGLAVNANVQDMLLKNNPDYKGLSGAAELGYTRRLFLGGDGVFSNIVKSLSLFVPLLTMGLIGREVQNGTFRLLYSSPVKLREIVIGKYLAIMIYNLMLVLILGVFMITASLSMIKIDYGMLISAALGFYLLTCAYTAIGMFMSSISTYQIIAAVGTFLVVFCLSLIGDLWQQYDFVRDLTFFLHLPGRAKKMQLGLITTKDVIYFLVIVFMFMSFTILRLRAARESKGWHIHAIRYSLVVVAALTIGYISSRPMLTGYWDTTAQDKNTIHKNTQLLIREMGDEPLEVTLYVNLLGPGGGAGLPVGRNAYLSNVWEKYVRFKPAIRFNYVYYYDHDSTIMGSNIFRAFRGKSLDYIAAKAAENRDMEFADFLKPAAIRKLIDLRPENLQLVMQLKYKGRTAFLRTFQDTKFWPDEMHVAAVLKRLILGKAPKCAFVTGHYERNIFKTGEREFAEHTARKLNRESLVNMGFDVDTISLDKEDIPPDLTTLVLADPKSELSVVCQEKIRKYLSSGGNMFILGEPGKQQMVNPVLQQLGVSLMDGVLVSQHKEEMPDIQKVHYTRSFLSIRKDPSGKKINAEQEKDAFLFMPRSAAIDYTDTAGFTYTPLLMTEKGISWLKKGKLVADSAMVEFRKEEGDVWEQGGFITLLAMHRQAGNKEQRVVVAGDADFLGNASKVQHKHGILLHSWLGDGAFPVYIPRTGPPDILLTISGNAAERLKLFYVWILPGFILLAGTVLLIRRKRK